MMFSKLVAEVNNIDTSRFVLKLNTTQRNQIYKR